MDTNEYSTSTHQEKIMTDFDPFGDFEACLDAVWEGDAAALQTRLAAGDRIDWGARNSETTAYYLPPLHHAIAYGHTAVVKLLLEAKADVDETELDLYGGYTPLHRACVHDRTDITVLLLEAEPDINRRNADGMTPCWLAASRGHMGSLHALKTAGANLETPDRAGVTPLQVATVQGYPDACQLLGGDPSRWYQDDSSCSATQEAADHAADVHIHYANKSAWGCVGPWAEGSPHLSLEELEKLAAETKATKARQAAEAEAADGEARAVEPMVVEAEREKRGREAEPGPDEAEAEAADAEPKPPPYTLHG